MASPHAIPLTDGMRTGTPKVSIIMLVYERAEFISAAVRSAQAQTETNWEMIIVQDGDNDRVRTTVLAAAATEPRINFQPRGARGNIAQATNHGVSLAKGDYIAILDDDDEWSDCEKIACQLRYLTENPDCVACGTGVIVVDEAGNELMRYTKPFQDGQIRAVALKANPIAHSSALFRKTTFLSVQGYDETLENFQDWDFWLKLGKVGKLRNLREHMLKYRLYQNSSSAKKMRSNARSALIILRSHREDYPGFWTARLMVQAYLVFSCLPDALRRRLFSQASQLKKRIFSAT